MTSPGRRTLCGLACLLLLLVPGTATPGQRDLVLSSRRLALVIGNNAYPSAPLRNAVADATAIAAALKRLGFDVSTSTNADLPAFERAVDDFTARLRPNDVALFFYAGHGLQIAGNNYLVPIDFNGVDAADVKARTYSAERVQEKLEAAARIRILILDACRNNPFSGSRSAQGGLSAMQGRGSLIAFSTSAGSVASDNPRGQNGLFTEQLLEVLQQPGLTTRDVFFKVRERVNDVSAGRQFPWVSDGLIGDIVLTGGNPPAPAPTSTSIAPTVAPTAVASPPAPAPRPNAPPPGASKLPTPAPGSARNVVSRALAGNAGAAHGVAISPGSAWVAAGYESGVVKLWDPRSGQAVASLAGHVGSVAAVSFSPDGRHLAAASGDRTVRIWDVEQQVEVNRLVGHTEIVSAIVFSPDGRTVATASADNSARLWNADTGRAVEVFSAHRDRVTSVAFSADGRSLVTGSRDQSVRVWDVGRARERMTLDTQSPVLSVAVTRDLGLIAAGTDDGWVTVWDGESGEVKWRGAAHKGTVWALVFSGNGTLLASGGADALVKTWETVSFKTTQTFRGHATWVRGVAFDSTNAWLASAGGDGDVRTWRIAAAK